MYYKDDFYKEFRTEKELCEYLEEIDSRAEWIRITSKKLKVAAAGEETCTEVPGISLEALEKDTLSHSRLVLILPERICYIGNSAIKSLKGRARIDGKALADVDKKTLAEILNKCLKVARGRALIRFCEGKIRAVLSGDEKDYAIISMPDMYMVTSAYIHGDYEKATFLNGYADHYSVTASWQLEDTKLTDVYKELMQNYGRKTDKDIKAVVRITTSDVGVSGANIFYSLQEPTRNVILGNALKVTHKNCKGMEDFTENIESIFDYYREVLKGVMRLCDIWIEHFVYEEASLEGAEFEIYAAEDIFTPDHQVDEQGNRHVIYAKDTLVKTVTTNKNGEAVIKDLPLGKYRVKETKAPAGFVLNPDSQEVSFIYKDQNTPEIEEKLEFSNERQKVELSVEKQDAETGKALKGATFGLYNKEAISSGDKVIVKADTLLQEITSNEKGKAAFTLDLPLGRYYVKELQAPAGYVSSDEILEFDATYQGQDVKTIKLKSVKKNQPTTVEVTKADITTGTELDGASMSVLDKDGNVIDSWTSVKDSPHVIKRLQVGKTYILREELAPYGYLRATDVEFTISDTAEVQKVKMEDEVPVARLLVNKKGEFLDSVSLLDNAKGMIEHLFNYVTGNLTDVTFNVYAAEAIRAADGVSADYYAADELVASITTDGNGIAQMDNLPLGRYYIVEKEPSHGYVLDNEPRYVDLTYRDQDTPLVTYSADWQNARQRVQVEVLKKEKDSNKVLSGAIFGLYAADDIVSSKGKVLLAKDTLIELKTTDEDGKIRFVADLPVDSRYYIKELAAPDGYVTDQEPQEFTFEYQGSGTSVAEYAFTFEDEQTTVELSKADLTDKKELPGASLKVTDEDGNTVDEWVSKEEAHIIKGLIVGKKYKMTETKPADGYVTAESIEFTVENTKEVQKHQMLDDVTKVEISKKDITDSSEVPGAKLIILDKDGKKVESWTSTDKPHMVEKLPVGEYTLREEQAPDGYLIAEDVKFTVKDTGKVQKVKMKDAHPYGKLVIKKTDSTSKAALSGAEFELREKESGKVVEKLVTDKTGTATSGKIPIATYKNGKVEKTVEYILVETKAPNGYELSSKKEEIRFEYKDGKTKVIEIVKEIKNTKSPSGNTPTGNSPKTGDSTNIWLPILLAVLSACGIGGVIWYKKKKGN